MKYRRQKQIAKLLQLRSQKERLAQYKYKGEIDELSDLRRKTLVKETVVEELEKDLYGSLETRLHEKSIITDPGARFKTFVMSTNAARENLLVQEGLAENLREDLKAKREVVSDRYDDLVAARTHVEKLKNFSNIIENEERVSRMQQDEAEIDENSTRPAYTKF